MKCKILFEFRKGKNEINIRYFIINLCKISLQKNNENVMKIKTNLYNLIYINGKQSNVIEWRNCIEKIYFKSIITQTNLPSGDLYSKFINLII